MKRRLAFGMVVILTTIATTCDIGKARTVFVSGTGWTTSGGLSERRGDISSWSMNDDASRITIHCRTSESICWEVHDKFLIINDRQAPPPPGGGYDTEDALDGTNIRQENLE